jgi:hypothetical protein
VFGHKGQLTKNGYQPQANITEGGIDLSVGRPSRDAHGPAQPQDASIAHHSVTLAPGETALFDQPVGEYLQPGIHHGPLGAEIWLQP